MIKFFPISWHTNSNDVHIYGVQEFAEQTHSGACCLRVIQPPCFFDVLINKFDPATIINGITEARRGQLHFTAKIVHRPLLCGVATEPDGSRKKWPILRLEFSKYSEFTQTRYLLTQTGLKIADTYVKFDCCGQEVDLWFHYALTHRLPIANWLDVECDPAEKRVTLCPHEYIVKRVQKSTRVTIPPFIPILAYDIEVYSAVTNKFPEASCDSDKIFQIALVFQPDASTMKRWLITRWPVNELCDRFAGTSIILVNSEVELIKTMVDVVRETCPLLMIGYNNMKFDGPYIIDRATGPCPTESIYNLTLHAHTKATLREITWSSAAMPDQKFKFMSGEGITTLDLLPYIQQRDKLASYKLDAVAEHHLGTHKDDMTPAELFAAYESSSQKLPNADAEMTRVGAYCLQDTQLVLDLYNHLYCSSSLVALADSTSCRIQDLNTRGAQYKVMSTIRRTCFEDDIVINRRGKQERASFQGALVFPPKIGLHENVGALDFTSLYPSIIIAQNLCVSTIVPEHETRVDLSKCSVYEWEEHIKCPHDERWQEQVRLSEKCTSLRKGASSDPVKWHQYLEALREKDECGAYKPTRTFCTTRRITVYNGYEGVFPKILKRLFAERQEVKTRMKNAQGAERIALNALQLALKVAANSMYGFTGSSTSEIPCVSVAECTTYHGRRIIAETAKYITEELKGVLLYGDTDSNYVIFPHIACNTPEGYQQLFKHFESAAQIISARYPAALNIAFENEIYAKWLIVNKKNYVYSIRNPDGTMHDKVGAKGVLLVRRDNCKWVRYCYEKIVRAIFAGHGHTDIIEMIFQEALKLFLRHVSISEMIITKSVGSWGNGCAVEDGNKLKMGRYIVPRADTVPEGYSSKEDFYRATLPAHVQLAIRMNARGTMVVPGERIGYVIIETLQSTFDSPLKNRLETCEFINKHGIKIDYLYYINNMISAAETLLGAYAPRPVNRECPKKRKCDNLYDHYGQLCRVDSSARYCDEWFLIMHRKALVNRQLRFLFQPRIHL